LVMEMSLSDPTVTAADVNEGRANTLVDAVLAGMLEIHCRIHYIMVLEDSVDGARACQQQRALQKLSDSSKDDFPVVWIMARVYVEDYQDEMGETLMYWTVAFPVLKIGDAYTNWAVGQGKSVEDEAGVNETALNGMYEDSYYALQRYIQRGYMNNQLPETAKAVADPDEVADPAPAAGAYPSEQLNPHPLHPMRVAGMIVLVVTLVSTFLLVKLSARRKKEREMDSAIAEINKGGLVTEEGLDLMLDVGRRESEKAGLSSTEIEVVLNGQQHEAEEKDSEEPNLMLPMPGYLGKSMPSSPKGADETDGAAKKESVLRAAKGTTSRAAASTDANKPYSFLSMFGSNEEDSEPEDHEVLPPSRNDVEAGTHERCTSPIAGFMNMFSFSQDEDFVARSSTAGGSKTGGSTAGDGSKADGG